MSAILSRAAHTVAGWVVGLFLVFLFRFRFEGRGNVPRTGPVLLLANHQSFLDPLLIAEAAPRWLVFLARKTLFVNRILARFMRLFGTVPINQESGGEGLRAIAAELQAGRAVVVFPEGERTWDGSMQPFRAGITLVMRRAKVPIVPVGVAGAFEALPRTKTWPSIAPPFLGSGRNAIAVCVGKPIPPERFEGMDRDEILTVLFEEVKRCADRAEAIRRREKPRNTRK